ncbi:hypothetical protein [Tsukamurella columbiensis]|uniref:Uncharacterized protein n=1 Tax=Tsukamurella columbiensis TaxID=128509 RepID=A0ABX1LLH0_9ACTN|nr:hypothetical protein [Tsukamurella columbiensis]NMD58315.1 hypothetical protein [Tsukamurella columbiensis]
MMNENFERTTISLFAVNPNDPEEAVISDNYEMAEPTLHLVRTSRGTVQIGPFGARAQELDADGLTALAAWAYHMAQEIRANQ